MNMANFFWKVYTKDVINGYVYVEKISLKIKIIYAI